MNEIETYQTPREIVTGLKHHFNNSVTPLRIIMEMGCLKENDAPDCRDKLLLGIDILCSKTLDKSLLQNLHQLKELASNQDWTSSETIQSLQEKYDGIINKYAIERRIR